MERRNLYGEAFNFGTETHLNVIDLVNLIIKIIGRDNLEPLILNEASNEIREQYLDCTKAKKTLNWQAKYPIEIGLEKTIKWYQQYLTKTYPKI